MALSEFPSHATEVTAKASMAAGAAASGFSGAVRFLGLTESEWTILGIIAGVVIGAGGLGVQTWAAWRRDRREQQALLRRK